jgi:hypothetical protein
MKKTFAVALLLMLLGAAAVPDGSDLVLPRRESISQPSTGFVRLADGSDPPAGKPGKPPKPNLAA